LAVEKEPHGRAASVIYCGLDSRPSLSTTTGTFKPGFGESAKQRSLVFVSQNNVLEELLQSTSPTDTDIMPREIILSTSVPKSELSTKTGVDGTLNLDNDAAEKVKTGL
jgi:hypothetical protein